jgi:hypothetical protein
MLPMGPLPFFPRLKPSEVCARCLALEVEYTSARAFDAWGCEWCVSEGVRAVRATRVRYRAIRIRRMVAGLHGLPERDIVPAAFNSRATCSKLLPDVRRACARSMMTCSPSRIP